MVICFITERSRNCRSNKLKLLYVCVQSFVTAWKVSKYGVFSGLNAGKYGREKTPYLETFQTVCSYIPNSVFRIQSNIWNGAFCDNSLRLKTVNYFCKKLNVKCLTRFWIRLCTTISVKKFSISILMSIFSHEALIQ